MKSLCSSKSRLDLVHLLKHQIEALENVRPVFVVKILLRNARRFTQIERGKPRKNSLCILLLLKTGNGPAREELVLKTARMQLKLIEEHLQLVVPLILLNRFELLLHVQRLELNKS